MHSRRTRWFFIALALITNLGGGPMAWANLATSGHCHGIPAPVVKSATDCPEHQAASGQQDPGPAQPLPCCDGGSCACAAPPAPFTLTLIAPTDLRHDTVHAPVDTRSAAADLLDDTLRPPIS